MRKYISLLISIIAAFILWVSVNLNNEYEGNLKAQVVIKNIDSDRSIKSDYPSAVDLRIRGRGWKLLLLYFFSPPRVFIDLSNIRQNLSVNLLLNDYVKFSLPENIHILDVNPRTLNFELDKKITRKVPVSLKYESRNNHGFTYPPVIIPDSVIISGAASVVSKIEAIPTEKVLIEKLGNYKVKAHLVNPNEKLIKLSSNSVEVTFSVEQIVEREFMVPVRAIDVPADKEVIFFPPSVKVIVRGTILKIIDINPEDLVVDADTVIKVFVRYQDVVNDKTGLVKPRLIVRGNLNLVSVSPEGLEYIIRQK